VLYFSTSHNSGAMHCLAKQCTTKSSFFHSINKVCFSAKKLSKSVHVVDTAADSQCFSMGRTTPKNCPFSGGSQPHLIHGFLGPCDSARNGMSISSAFFVQLTSMPNRYTDTQTDRHTDHATCDTCSNRQCMRCGLKPRPRQQQCRSNIFEATGNFVEAPSTPATMANQHCRMLQVERYFQQCRMLLRHCCRFWKQCRTKFRPFDKVETN